MSSACTPILVGVIPLVSEILLSSKTVKFPFRGMDYSPWSSKNLIDRNRLKKFMHVGIDVTCMHTNFGGCGLFSFGDIATFKNSQIPLSVTFVFVYFCLCLCLLLSLFIFVFVYFCFCLLLSLFTFVFVYFCFCLLLFLFTFVFVYFCLCLLLSMVIKNFN